MSGAEIVASYEWPNTLYQVIYSLNCIFETPAQKLQRSWFKNSFAPYSFQILMFIQSSLHSSLHTAFTNPSFRKITTKSILILYLLISKTLYNCTANALIWWTILHRLKTSVANGERKKKYRIANKCHEWCNRSHIPKIISYALFLLSWFN